MDLRELEARVRDGSPIPFPWDQLLTAASVIQRAGMALRRLRTVHHVPARVISFGNLTAGGSGKTPAVIERAGMECAAGHRVAVMTRGHGAGTTRGVAWALNGERQGPGCEWLGDEPEMISHRLPKVAVVRCSDRVAGAKVAIDTLGCDTLLLDDGYQYLRLHRDENVLVVDAANPFGNGRVLPRGILREPIAAAARATHILVTRCDQAADLTRLLSALSASCPGVTPRLTTHAPMGLRDVKTGESIPLQALRGREIAARCAIGNPEGFRRTLESLECVIASFRAFQDHALMPVDALRNGMWTVITEKDAVKLKDCPPDVFALKIVLRDWVG